MYKTIKLILSIMIAASLLLTNAKLSMAENVPDTIQIKSLSNLFGPVAFDHSMHIDIAGGCAVCHHRGPGTPAKGQKCAQCHPDGAKEQPRACQACHPANPFSTASLKEQADSRRHHRDILGLKGAYHQACMGCHKEMSGPIGCQDCHQPTAAGDAFYHSGKFAPQAADGTAKSH